MVVCDGDDLLPLLVFIARVANPIAPFLATVLVPSPWSTRRSSFFSAERWATLAVNACWSDPSFDHLAKAQRLGRRWCSEWLVCQWRLSEWASTSTTCQYKG